MTDIIRILQKRDPRYEIKKGNDVAVTIRTPRGSCECVSAELVNISVGGAKFKTSKPFSVKDMVAVEIAVEHPRRRIEASAEVCWMAPAAGDGWWLGCSLRPRIPEKVLHDFAMAGILERREHPRESVSLPTIAKWELTGETVAARILDFSRGGFCLLLQTEGKLGERVLVQFDREGKGEIQVHGKALWQTENRDGFMIGCEILHPQDFNVLKEMSDVASSAKPRRASGVHWFRRWNPQHATDEQTQRQPSRRSSVCILAVCATVLLGLNIWRSQTSPIAGELTVAPANMVSSPIISAAGSDASHKATLASLRLMPRSVELQRNGAGAGTTRHRPAPTTLFTATRSLAPNGQLAGGGRMVVVSKRRDSSEQTRGNHHRPRPASLARTASTRQLTPSNRAAFFHVSNEASRQQATRSFHRARDFYILGQYDLAASVLERAIQDDVTNAEYRYFLAMIQFQRKQFDEAERSIIKAVELERERPVTPWGQKMERYQGATRVWLEQTRLRVSQM
jgi:hypothetical protein